MLGTWRWMGLEGRKGHGSHIIVEIENPRLRRRLDTHHVDLHASSMHVHAGVRVSDVGWSL